MKRVGVDGGQGPALGARCGNCGYGIAWIALKDQTALLALANKLQPPKRRYGGMYDLDDITQAGLSGRAQEGWVEDANAGKGSLTPTRNREGVGSGYNERAIWHCRNRGCARKFTRVNNTLLAKYLHAIAAQTDFIVL